MKVKDFITHLQQYYPPEEKILCIVWQVDDVLYRADELGIEITEEEAEEILNVMNHHHDACIGINWDVIDCHLQMLRT